MRPTLEEIAEARRKAQWFLSTIPDHSMADTLRTFIAATAPLTKEQAIPVMIEHTNKFGEWTPNEIDEEQARGALDGRCDGTWEKSIRAQWATLVHFMGGAE